MECPRTGDDLARVLGILQWMAHSIPRFAEMASPLRKVLEDIYKDANSRDSKKVRSRIVTMFGWTKEHTRIWNQIKEEMAKALTLTHRDPKKVLHLFTDASQTGWAGILVQVDREEIEKHPQYVLERKFEPLGCMGGNFDSAQFNWPTVEQEGYAVKRSIERMWYHIDDSSELQIYSDNLNLKSSSIPKLMSSNHFLVSPTKSTVDKAMQRCPAAPKAALTSAFTTVSLCASASTTPWFFALLNSLEVFCHSRNLERECTHWQYSSLQMRWL